jgi:hypothetical protein
MNRAEKFQMMVIPRTTKGMKIKKSQIKKEQIPKNGP